MENTSCLVEKFLKVERIMFILKLWYFGFERNKLVIYPKFIVICLVICIKLSDSKVFMSAEVLKKTKSNCGG